MTVNGASLGDVGALATALGLLGPDGSVDTTWFTDPGSAYPRDAAEPAAA